MPPSPEQLAGYMKLLSAGTRVRIVGLLKGRCLCVNALADRLHVTQGAVSQHLRLMRKAGLVTEERRGCYVHYRLNPETLAAWREAIDRLLDPNCKLDINTQKTQKGAMQCVAKKKNRKAAKSPKT